MTSSTPVLLYSLSLSQPTRGRMAGRTRLPVDMPIPRSSRVFLSFHTRRSARILTHPLVHLFLSRSLLSVRTPHASSPQPPLHLYTAHHGVFLHKAVRQVSRCSHSHVLLYSPLPRKCSILVLLACGGSSTAANSDRADCPPLAAVLKRHILFCLTKATRTNV